MKLTIRPMEKYYCIQPLIYLLLILLTKPVTAQHLLVKTEKAQNWPQGLQHQLNCQVVVPYKNVIAAQSSAELTYLLPSGTQIRKGQLLAKQDDYYLTMQLKRLMAKQQKQQVALTHHKAELLRLTNLGSEHVSQSQLSNQTLTRDQLKASVIEMSLQIEEINHRLQKLNFYAEHSGEVLTTKVMLGEIAEIGDPILTFVNYQDKELYCEFPINNLKGITNFSLSSFSHPELGELRLSRASNVINDNTQMLALYLGNQQKLKQVHIGERLNIKLSSPIKNASLIPASAMVLLHKQKVVWRVNEKNKVERIPVNLLKNLTDNFLIQGDIHSGDLLVTIGQRNLKVGQEVRLLPKEANNANPNKNDTIQEKGEG